jgi:hypothetical protein
LVALDPSADSPPLFQEPSDPGVTFRGDLVAGDATKLDPDHLIHERPLPEFCERCGALEARVSTDDDIGLGRCLEESKRATGPGWQNELERSGVFEHLRVSFPIEALENSLSLGLRESGAFGIDEDSVARAEILRELLHATDLERRVVREAVQEHVGNAMTDDVEAGVP